jgi:predicted MFS family arabinose efflux permease
VALVASSHILWISFASVTDRAARTFHTTSLSIGLLVSVGPICSAIFSIPAGALSDRFGYRAPLLWAGLATVVFAFLRPLAGSFPSLLALTVVLLVPQPFLINAIADLVNRHFPDEESATATGLGTMSIFLGITVGVAVTPGLVAVLGIRGAQFLYAAFAALALVAFWVVTPRRVPDRLRAPEELTMRVAVARVLGSRTLWKLSAVLFCGFGFYLGMTTWLSEILKPHGINDTGAGLVAGTITVGGIVGSVALGAASDHIRRRKPFIIAAGLVSVPTLLLLGHLGSFAALVIVAFVLGFFLLAALPVSIAWVSEEPSLGAQVASTGVGVILMAGNLGGALVVAIMGVIKNAQGNYSGAVLFAAALAVVAVAIAVTLRDPLAATSTDASMAP